ncbi:MAG TPA: non-homologous end-joining DNA ligase [Candidatus Nanopelagicales bacterium]|nr:non-homologous end-joining DNA ligase [Candidatus Nanopelagicales bacterium]
MAGNGGTLDVGGRSVKLTNLDKVLYPATGTTKADVLHYYLAVAPRILPLLRDRPVTRKRWPDGVDHDPFFEKNIPRGAPEWLARTTLHHSGARSGRGARDIDYPLVDDEATLVWLAQSGALELHAPQWRIDRATGEPLDPDRLVVDLDPGDGAGLDACREVALLARDMLAGHGMTTWAVLSGSKGMQLYADLPPATERGRDLLARAGSTSEYALSMAKALEQHVPQLVVSNMSKELRPGKVLVDWSQNNPAKTTIVPWSLRGRARPTAACPVTWDEVEAGDLHQLTMAEATDRALA